MELKLKRPLIFFDLETTGTNVLRDRIVEISVVKLFPDGHTEEKTRRVNPGIKIPAEAIAVHHITDEDVAEEPYFSQLAKSLHDFFADSDIAGFNSNRFDVPLLIQEFERAGIPFEMSGRRFIDVQNIFHKMEQRTLVAAYRFYCGKDLSSAHQANADTLATIEVLKAQLDRYPQLENDVDALDKVSRIDGAIDLAGMIKRNKSGEAVFNFGKHKGKTVAEVYRKEPSFLNWVMQAEFTKNTKDTLATIWAELRKKEEEKRNSGKL